MFGGIGFWELVIIICIVMIIFGADKLPGLGTGLGKGLGEIKKAIQDSRARNVTPKPNGRKTESTPKKRDDLKT